MKKFIKQVNENSEQSGNGRKFPSLPVKSILVGAGVIAVSAVVLYILSPKTEVSVKTGVGQKDVEKVVESVVRPVYQKTTQLEQQQKEIKDTLAQLNETLKQLNETMKSRPKRTSQKGILDLFKSKPEKATKKGSSSKAFVPSQVLDEEISLESAKAKVKLLHKTSIEPEKKKGFSYTSFAKEKGIVKKKKKNEPTVYIPAGSIVEGKLMYGFVAPEKGMLPPVLIELTRPVRTANDFFIPLERCIITTKAQYNLSQGLALLGGRGSTLSCVLENGKVVEVSVNVAVGEETGEEGVVVGLSGKEKWLTGKDLAKITALYSATGFTGSMQQSLIQQSITATGNVNTAIRDRGMYSLYGGVNTALNKFAEFWMRKYEEKVPAIKVNPKKVFVVFVNGADLKVKEEEL